MQTLQGVEFAQQKPAVRGVRTVNTVEVRDSQYAAPLMGGARKQSYGGYVAGYCRKYDVFCFGLSARCRSWVAVAALPDLSKCA